MITCKTSIIIPTVRPNIDNLNKVIHDLGLASKKNSWEAIFVGPFPLPDEIHRLYNIKYIKDFGHSSRAFQIGSLFAEGEYLTWVMDDSWVYEDSLDKALEVMDTQDPKDLMALRYIEGTNHQGNPADFGDFYWTARYHFCRTGTEADWGLAGLNPEWKTPIITLIKTEYFRWLGGLDCRFEHVNMNVHDLAFRAQKNGSYVHMSPDYFVNFDWEPRTPQNSVILRAFFENDLPLFKQLYYDNSRPIQIPYDNWQQAEPVWSRKNYTNWPNIGTT